MDDAHGRDDASGPPALPRKRSRRTVTEGLEPSNGRGRAPKARVRSAPPRGGNPSYRPSLSPLPSIQPGSVETMLFTLANALETVHRLQEDLRHQQNLSERLTRELAARLEAPPPPPVHAVPPPPDRAEEEPSPPMSASRPAESERVAPPERVSTPSPAASAAPSPEPAPASAPAPQPPAPSPGFLSRPLASVLIALLAACGGAWFGGWGHRSLAAAHETAPAHGEHPATAASLHADASAAHPSADDQEAAAQPAHGAARGAHERPSATTARGGAGHERPGGSAGEPGAARRNATTHAEPHASEESAHPVRPSLTAGAHSPPVEPRSIRH